MNSRADLAAFSRSRRFVRPLSGLRQSRHRHERCPGRTSSGATVRPLQRPSGYDFAKSGSPRGTGVDPDSCQWSIECRAGPVVEIAEGCRERAWAIVESVGKSLPRAQRRDAILDQGADGHRRADEDSASCSSSNTGPCATSFPASHATRATGFILRPAWRRVQTPQSTTPSSTKSTCSSRALSTTCAATDVVHVAPMWL